MKTFLALFMGAADLSRPMPPDPETAAGGMAAWSAWMAANADRLVDAGGPLGVTKAVDGGGVRDTRNAVAGYVVLTADSHDEAAKLFLDHPHFSIFPGDRVEIMERMPIPTA